MSRQGASKTFSIPRRTQQICGQ
nr:unnamed protein product [Callosobruchus chinensis]